MTGQAERTFADMRAKRAKLVDCGIATDPQDLKANDVFHVIGFAVSDGVVLRSSGVFVCHQPGGRATVHIDGDPEPTIVTYAQAGFFPLAGSPPAMVVTVTRFRDLAHHLGTDFIDTDARSDAARAAETARTPCPCGAVRGDGSKCPEWPDCVIP